MASDLRQLYIPAASEGLDLETPPYELRRGKGRTVVNATTHHRGKLVSRGPIEDPLDVITPGSTVGAPVGVWRHRNKLLIGRRQDSSNVAKIPFHKAPWLKAAAATDLDDAATDAGGVQVFDMDTRTLTTLNPTLSQVPFSRSVRIGNYVYGPGYGILSGGADPVVNVNGGFIPQNSLVAWDGTAALPMIPANFPSCVMDVAEHYERLWCLAALDPGAALTEANYQPNTLYYTDAGAGSTAIISGPTEWQDSSGLYNKIVIGSPDKGDYCVGLARVNSNLVIFKRRSIYVLYGYSPSTFTVKRVSESVGCVDVESIVTTDEGVFFLSQQGYMFFDGSRFINLTEDIQDHFLGAVLPRTATQQKTRFARANGSWPGYIYLATGDVEYVDNAEPPQIPGLPGLTAYALASAVWTLDLSKKAWSVQELQTVYDVGAQGVHLPSWNVRSQGDDYVRGVTHKHVFATTNLLKSPPIDQSLVYKDQVTISATTYKQHIPIRWRSGVLEMGGKGASAQIHRLTLDYSLVRSGGADSGAGLLIRVRDSNNTVLTHAVSAVATSTNDTDSLRQRAVFDVFVEVGKDQAGGVHFEVEMSFDPDTNYVRSEIHGLTVEYQVTREQR